MDIEENEISYKIREMEMQWVSCQKTEDMSPEKTIQYSVSSAILYPKQEQNLSENESQMIYQVIYKKLQDGEKLTIDEENFLVQNDSISYKKAKSMEHENEKLIQELRKCHTKQEVQRVEANHLNSINSWYKLVEDDIEISVEEKIDYILFKDAKLSAIQNVVEKYMETTEYKRLPEYEANSQLAEETVQMDDDVERLIRCTKAKAGYADVRRLFGGQESNDDGDVFSFDARG